MRILFGLAIAALVAGPAFAGEDAPGSTEGLTGFDCENMCPLAHQANERRALGTETLAVGSKIQADACAIVVRNLAKI